MIDIELQKDTAIQNERQYSKKEIIDDIIKILANNKLSITEAREILKNASKKIGNQMVIVNETSGWIDAKNYGLNGNIS